MTFIEQFEQELARKLDTEGDSSAIIRWCSECVLESYRNGITAGQSGTTVKRQGESRRRSPWTLGERVHNSELVRRGMAARREREVENLH